MLPLKFLRCKQNKYSIMALTGLPGRRALCGDEAYFRDPGLQAPQMDLAAFSETNGVFFYILLQLRRYSKVSGDEATRGF